MRKLPVGVQDFETLRKDGYLYVDKTEYLYRLMSNGKSYFLSRPRRFGKSLLLSMMKSYFEGKRELFEGLKITELTKDDSEAFAAYPVFHFDFNKDNFRESNATDRVLDEHLRNWETVYGANEDELSLSERFRKLLEKANALSGRRAIVLVDEYDKPLLETENEILEHNRAVFRGFFSTLKSYDGYIKFVFMTGVTKFSKVSIFSDLNQLQDISLNKFYSGICGITEVELIENFSPEIAEMAMTLNLTREECIAKLRKFYDGYHFYPDAEGVYNPFSLLNAFSNREFRSYWFETGTPTFLVKKIADSNFDAKTITEGSLYSTPNKLSDYRIENKDPVPLLYQTGYLTILGEDREFQSYLMGYPNEEVKYGLLENLAPLFLHSEDEPAPLDVRSFGLDIKNGNTDGLRDRFVALFARLPYPSVQGKVQADAYAERDFQNVIYITFMLLGQFIQCEVHNATGRADAIVETRDYVWVFEFKRDRSAEEALRQIEEKGYALPYAADPRTILKIGAGFDSAKRELSGWLVG